MSVNDRPMTAAPEEERTAMFTPEEVNQLRPTWDGIQTRFIDEPRKSVEEADALVASTVQRLTDSFARARTDLEARWSTAFPGSAAPSTTLPTVLASAA